MKKITVINILGVLSVVAGLGLIASEFEHAISLSMLEIAVIRIAGIFLFIAGVIIPAVCYSNKKE